MKIGWKSFVTAWRIWRVQLLTKRIDAERGITETYTRLYAKRGKHLDKLSPCGITFRSTLGPRSEFGRILYLTALACAMLFCSVMAWRSFNAPEAKAARAEAETKLKAESLIVPTPGQFIPTTPVKIMTQPESLSDDRRIMVMRGELPDGTVSMMFFYRPPELAQTNCRANYKVGSIVYAQQKSFRADSDWSAPTDYNRIPHSIWWVLPDCK
jgi:hypothetical protein